MTAVKVFQKQKENPEIVYNNTYQKIIISSSFCRKSGDWTKSKSGDHVNLFILFTLYLTLTYKLKIHTFISKLKF